MQDFFFSTLFLQTFFEKKVRTQKTFLVGGK